MSATARRFGGGALTTWSLLALVAGVVLGVVGRGPEGGLVAGLAALVEPLGILWINALQMTVVPLIITHMLAAIAGNRAGGSVGSLGVRAVVLFVVLLLAVGLATVVAAPAVLGLWSVPPGTMADIRAGTPIPAAVTEAASSAAPGFGEWIAGIVPSNIFTAAVGGEILPLLLFTVLFALAVTRLPAEQREPLGRGFVALAEAMTELIGWILWGTPVGVFALVLGMTLEAGVGTVGLLAVWVVFVSGFLLLFTGALYPATAVAARIPVRDFARAVAPAQLVAVSTRSSIASLPALVEGGRDHLELPASGTGFVLPLCVSSFKINRTISSTCKLLFLAHVAGIALGPAQIATFLVTVIILSFSSVGVPGGGGAFKTLPAYLAAGVPIEGVVILEAVETIPDIFKTLINVTGDMSVAAILARPERVGDRGMAGALEGETPELAGEMA